MSNNSAHVHPPSLFLVGKHKAGTTALADLLNQHPAVWVPPTELHHLESDLQVHRLAAHKFLTRDLMSKYNVRRSNYLSNYHGLPSGTVVAGDRTPSYLFSATSAAEIHAFNPAAKIIALFREPVSFMHSLHSQNRYNLYEDERNFIRALELEDDRREGRSIPRSGAHVSYMLLYRQHIRYAEQLQRYYDHFPPENIQVIIYESFRDDNLPVVRNSYRFLGVDPTFTPVLRRPNQNKRRRFPTVKRLVRLLARTGVPAKLAPTAAYKAAARQFSAISTDYEKREPLDRVERQALKARCVEDVEEFAKLLQKYDALPPDNDLLALWGYA